MLLHCAATTDSLRLGLRPVSSVAEGLPESRCDDSNRCPSRFFQHHRDLDKAVVDHEDAIGAVAKRLEKTIRQVDLPEQRQMLRTSAKCHRYGRNVGN